MTENKKSRSFEEQKGRGFGTAQQAREIGRRGGVAKQKKEKKKKELKERINLALELVAQKQCEDLRSEGSEQEAELIESVGVEVYKLLNILQDDIVEPETKIRLINTLWDRTEGKAIQKVENEQKGIIQTINLDPKELKNAMKDIDKEI